MENKSKPAYFRTFSNLAKYNFWLNNVNKGKEKPLFVHVSQFNVVVKF